MKNKIILIIFIICSLVNMLSSMENNNNNKYKYLTKEIWLEIALKLINIKDLETAKTIPEFEKVINPLKAFALISKKHYQVVKHLINVHKFEINDKRITFKEYYDQTKKGIIQEIKEKLESKTSASFEWFNNINSIGKFNNTALMYATIHNCEDVAKLLIDNKADIDAKNEDGRTALMIAANYGRIEIAKLLIQNGADINITDNDGNTLSKMAITSGHREICDLLKNRVI